MLKSMTTVEKTIIVVIALLALSILTKACDAAEIQMKSALELLGERTRISEAISQLEKTFTKEQKAWEESKPKKDHDAKVKTMNDEFNKSAPAIEYTAKIKKLQEKYREATNQREQVEKAYFELLEREKKADK